MALFKILAIVFLGVAVVGGGTYLVMNNTGSVAVEEGEQSMENEEENTNSLEALLGLGQNLTCTFSRVEGDATVAGTTYVSGGQIRSDSMIEQPGMSLESHMIMREGKMYTWTFAPQGTYAQVFTVADVEGAGGASTQDGAVSLDDKTDYECSPWMPDESKFNVPQDIDFIDMTVRTDGSANASATNVSGSVNVNVNAGGGVSGSGGQCAMCEQITDPGPKAECLAAFSCN